MFFCSATWIPIITKMCFVCSPPVGCWRFYAATWRPRGVWTGIVWDVRRSALRPGASEHSAFCSANCSPRFYLSVIFEYPMFFCSATWIPIIPKLWLVSPDWGSTLRLGGPGAFEQASFEMFDALLCGPELQNIQHPVLRIVVPGFIKVWFLSSRCSFVLRLGFP